MASERLEHWHEEIAARANTYNLPNAVLVAVAEMLDERDAHVRQLEDGIREAITKARLLPGNTCDCGYCNSIRYLAALLPKEKSDGK